MNHQWDSDPNRAQWWNNQVQQQAPPPPPPGANIVPGFFSGWTSHPVPPPFVPGWAPGTNLPPQGTWMSMRQFMAHNTSTHNNTSIAGYANPAYYPPHIPMPPNPMSSNMTSNGGPAPGGPAPGGLAPGGEASTIPLDLKKRTKAERRALKKQQQQQDNTMQSQRHHEAQQQYSQQQYPQQYQVQPQVQRPSQAPGTGRKPRQTKQQRVKQQQQQQQQQQQLQQQQQQIQPQDQQEPQQFQAQSQAQLPHQAPNAFPQIPASLPDKPPASGKKPRKKRGKAADTQLQSQSQPQQNPIPGFNPTPTFTPFHPTPAQHNPYPNRGPLRVFNRDPISAPSAASGGVPDPTPSYIAQSARPPRRLPDHQPLLVIIDLNGTLLHRPSPKAPSTFVERPGARAFLHECLDAFYVVIWSSARPDNVAKMVRQLLPEASQRARLVATWGRDRFGLSAADYNQRTQCYKRLTSVWGDAGVAAAHPLAGGRWGQENTVLIDDSAEKARSEPFNAVTIPEFLGKKGKDEVLPLVHEYLCVLSMQADVSAFVRTHPFKADRGTIDEYTRSVSEGCEVDEKATDGDEAEEEATR